MVNIQKLQNRYVLQLSIKRLACNDQGVVLETQEVIQRTKEINLDNVTKLIDFCQKAGL